VKINERSFSGRFFRPRPIVNIDDNSKSLLMAVPWGVKESAENVLQTAQEAIVGSGGQFDPELTVAVGQVPVLENTQQKLCRSVRVSNEKNYNQYNATDYTSAAEFLGLVVENKTLTWAQVGAIHLLIYNQKGLQPLCYSPDWAWQIQQEAPLLCQGVGLDLSCQIQTGSYRLLGGETVICIARSYIPQQLFTAGSPDLEELTRILAEESEQTPFWIATVNF
jgi:hypothetical protein